jgi:DNA invertase Pin-like site-specific DNA recombinase
VYVRVSEVGEREGPSFGSPEEQEAAAREWAEREGLEAHFNAEECVDLDVSGATAVADRKLGRLIERCEAGEFGGIVVRDERRFARDEIAGGVALDRLTECGARLKATWSGFDTGPFGRDVTPESRMVFDFFMAIGKAERARNRLARIKGAQRAAKSGLHLAARCPTGYHWVDRKKGGRTPTEGGGIGRLEPDPVMGPKVADAFRRRAAGESFEKLGRFLGLAGKSSARAVIQNRVYLGEATVPTERKGETRTVKNAHAPIVTETEWEQAQAAGGTWTPRSGKWSALARLGGIARCSGCGKPLAVGSLRGKEPYYSCTAEGCTQRVGIRAELLDEWVGLVVTDAVYDEHPALIAILAGDDRYARALEEVENARLELDAYRAEIKVSDVGAEAWKRDVAARKTALDLARSELRGVPRTQEAYRTPMPVTAEQWAAASKDERVGYIEAAMDRDRLARMVDKVVVKPVGRGKRVPVEQRAEVYFVGAETAAVAA